jgi:DNA-binding transcriptional ArsR family regulator
MDRQSKLKVLRAVVSLDRFTAGELMGTTGLERSQVDPQIARLRDEGIVEYDLEAAGEFQGSRPAHRPQRYYRLTLDPGKRSHAFAEIRSVRAALGEDEAPTYLIGTIRGQLEALQGLLSSLQERRQRLDAAEAEVYEAQLQRAANELDQALLESDEGSDAAQKWISELRKLHIDIEGQLSAVRFGEQRAQGAGLLEWLRRVILNHRWTAPSKAMGVEARAAANEFKEFSDYLTRLAPSYTKHARFDYAVCRIAAARAPEPEILLTLTDHLQQNAPPEHRHLYRYNHANVLAWAGRTEEAYPKWADCLSEFDKIEAWGQQAPFRTILCALVDESRLDRETLERLETMAGESGAVLAVVSSHNADLFGMSIPHPQPALRDPFYHSIEVAVPVTDVRYTIHGAGLRDLYRNEPGVSHLRLATTLYRIGFTPQQAWSFAMVVDRGKALLIVGRTEAAPKLRSTERLSVLLRQNWDAQVTKML